ncbi:MAG: homoserine dehydrogenase [Micavibrio sp.]|nr:homoserine dehydrogenase [Micavibrio sp.]
MSHPLRLGIAGLGTVGAGVIKIVQQHKELLPLRAGRDIQITAVSARTKNKARDFDISAYEWLDDPIKLATHPDVDVVLELIGGEEGAALTLVRTALENGKHVVTANKAMMAHHGCELAIIAEEKGVTLAYEAAVAGGIPAIKALREGAAANRIDAVYGILNGTCNYMLTNMRETGRDFDVILKEAQEMGYAEADPSFDVDGVDAAHKLCLLSSIAFGTKPDFENLKITGIRNITPTDIKFSGEFGYRIKLLGIAERTEKGIMQVLEPCLVPVEHPMGVVEDVYNAVFINGDAVDTVLLTGRGAGEGPTASAVMADVIDIAWGIHIPTFGVPVKSLKSPEWMDISDSESHYYLRLNVNDQAGVMADVSITLRDLGVSIESMSQHGRDPGAPVSIVLLTHETRHGDMLKACELFAKMDVVLDEPCLMRIETLE